MPQLTLATSAHSREYGNNPPVVQENFFSEGSPTDEDGVILQSRPGTVRSFTRGSGPGHGVFHQAGTFNGDIFTISNTTLYRGASSLGTILGTGPVKWAASDTEVVVTRGTYVYSYNGVNLLPITIPDGQDVIDVAYVKGFFVFVIDNSNTFYWSNLYDARTVSAIDFANAELLPDKLSGVFVVLGQVVFPGIDSTETWLPTGDQDLPLALVDAHLYSVGARGAAAITQMGDLIFMAGNNGKIYRIGSGLEPISNPGVEEVFAASTDCLAYSFTWGGHAFVCFKLDTTTQVFDQSTGDWTVFKTHGNGNFRPKCAINVGTDVYFGDDTGNDFWTFDPTTFSDDGEPLVGIFTFMGAIPGGRLTIDNLEVRGNTGNTVPLSGDDANPMIEVRLSRTRGNTWLDWRTAPLGAQGAYGPKKAMFNRYGQYRAPGVIGQGRITDVTPRRISSVWINEAQ